MQKKLAILSSYNTVCGNASYTHVLKEELSTHYETTVISVNHKLLTDAHPSATVPRKAYLQEIAKKLSSYDYVNIQFEPALYGNSLSEACVHIVPLIQACRALLFTFHRIPQTRLPEPYWKSALRNGTKIWKTLQAINASRQNKAFGTVIQALKEHKNSGHIVSGIVHTRREKDDLSHYYDYQDVIDFPITFLNKKQIAYYTTNREALRQKVFEKYTFDPNEKYVGIFGFLSENKGHHIAIDAIHLLPTNYKLAIFGAQHPQTIRDYDIGTCRKNPELFRRNNNAYISSLVDRVEAQRRKEEERGIHFAPDQARVRFLGSLSDEDFIEAITAMDYILIPYFETGQGGSGNASLALELETRTVFSRTFAFLDLAHYYPNCFEIADIGNAHEIAQRIYTWKKDVTMDQKRATARFCIENSVLVHKEALENGAQKALALKTALIAPEAR